MAERYAWNKYNLASQYVDSYVRTKATNGLSDAAIGSAATAISAVRNLTSSSDSFYRYANGGAFTEDASVDVCFAASYEFDADTATYKLVNPLRLHAEYSKSEEYYMSSTEPTGLFDALTAIQPIYLAFCGPTDSPEGFKSLFELKFDYIFKSTIKRYYKFKFFAGMLRGSYSICGFYMNNSQEDDTYRSIVLADVDKTTSPYTYYFNRRTKGSEAVKGTLNKQVTSASSDTYPTDGTQ